MRAIGQRTQERREADEERREQVEEVRRRLETGELDSDLAIVETAFALLDGDLPRLPPVRKP